MIRKKDDVIDIAITPFRQELAAMLSSGCTGEIVCSVAVHNRSIRSIKLGGDRLILAPEEPIGALKKRLANTEL